MAWIYQRPGSANWWIGYRVGGKQFLKSTRTQKKSEAEKELEKFEVMAVAKRNGALTQQFVNALLGHAQPIVTLSAGLDSWLTSCKGSTAPGTHERYSDVATQLREFFKADPVVADVGADELHAFLSNISERRAVGSVNLTRKILSVFFNYAVGRAFTPDKPCEGSKAV